MNAEAKVTAEHLQRPAYLYVRQSTLHQVLENTESTARQYALCRRAVTLGWPADQMVVIDHDQAQSAASANDFPPAVAWSRPEMRCFTASSGARSRAFSRSLRAPSRSPEASCTTAMLK